MIRSAGKKTLRMISGFRSFSCGGSRMSHGSCQRRDHSSRKPPTRSGTISPCRSRMVEPQKQPVLGKVTNGENVAFITCLEIRTTLGSPWLAPSPNAISGCLNFPACRSSRSARSKTLIIRLW
jgi:hypothetical protein